MFKVLTDGCEPTKGSKYSACIDLKSAEDVTIGAGETKLIPLGVAIDIHGFLEKYFDLNKGAVLDLFNLKDTVDEKVNFLASHGENPSLLKTEIERFLNSHYLQLMLRSSLSKHLIIANGVGVIDMDYPGEIMIRVHNPLKKTVIDYVKSIARVVSFNLLGHEQVFNFKEFATHEENNKDFKINKGDRVAQIALLEHKAYLFGIECEDERTGGFGSTGT